MGDSANDFISETMESERVSLEEALQQMTEESGMGHVLQSSITPEVNQNADIYAIRISYSVAGADVFQEDKTELNNKIVLIALQFCDSVSIFGWTPIPFANPWQSIPDRTNIRGDNRISYLLAITRKK